MRNRDEIFVRRPSDRWVRAGIGGGLLWLFWRPLRALFLVLVAATAVGMLVQPTATALLLVAVTGLAVVHYVRRRSSPRMQAGFWRSSREGPG